MQKRTHSISDVCVRFIDIVILIHMTETIACLTLCMHFMHIATGISSGVISVVLIVCTTLVLFDTIRFLLPCNSHCLVETPLCRLARTMV